MNNKIKLTALYNEHIKCNAKMVPFAKYEMPINYKAGIYAEYKAVRKNVGVFDVSHMGEIIITGSESIKFLQYITINDINKIKSGDAQYSAICNNDGGIKDDIIIYRLDKKYILIVNASNCDKIYNWMNINNNYDCKIKNESDNFSLLAVQGPKSRSLLMKLLNKSRLIKRAMSS